LSYFKDDEDRTLFQTLIMQIRPKEVIFEKGGLNQETLSILKNHIKNLTLNPVQSGREFPDASGALDNIFLNQYFFNSEMNEHRKGVYILYELIKYRI
jgi:DNA mismatch repair protein MSH6